MNVLVTGGAGLIGSHIVDSLLARGDRVKILDNLEPTTHPHGKPAWIPIEAEFIKGDVRNVDDWEKALKGTDAVFHEAFYGGFAPEISKMADVNVSGTAKMFEVIRKMRFDVKKIVVASSGAVYGEGEYKCPEHGKVHPAMRTVEQMERGEWELKCPVCGRDMSSLPLDEETSVDVTGVYSITKFAEERVSLAMGKEMGIPTVGLRYCLTFGPRQSLHNPYTGVCSMFASLIRNGLPPVIYEDGKQTRDFTFVKDVARANVLVLDSDQANFQVFNVGTGKPTSLLGFVRTLTKVLGKEMEPLIPGEFRPLDLRHLFTSIKKIERLGFEPRYSVEQGLREYVEWAQSQQTSGERFAAARDYLKNIGFIKKAKV